jgi:DNA-binding NarL/FixJ family response regulator
MIRVLICDDQDVVREGLRAILSTAPGIEVVGEASDGDEALKLVPQTQPNVVLMDLKMPGMNGVQATRAICNRYPDVRVLVLTTYDADEWVFDAIRSGAAGYLLKDTPRAGLIEAIRGTAAGKTHVDPAVAGRLFAQVAQVAAPPRTSVADELSPRELEPNGCISQKAQCATMSVPSWPSWRYLTGPRRPCWRCGTGWLVRTTRCRRRQWSDIA